MSHLFVPSPFITEYFSEIACKNSPLLSKAKKLHIQKSTDIELHWKEENEKGSCPLCVCVCFRSIFGTFMRLQNSKPKKQHKKKLMFKLWKCNYIITVYLSKCGPHFMYEQRIHTYRLYRFQRVWVYFLFLQSCQFRTFEKSLADTN